MTLTEHPVDGAPDGPDEAPVARGRRRRPPMNPVLAAELRQRMRNRWTPVVITVYLLLLAATVQLVYTGASSEQGVNPLEAASTGRTVFHWLLFFMLLLVCFLVPGFTAAAIAGERERQTLVPLQVTLMRPFQILVGKMAASLAFVALLTVATLPLISVTFIVGGVNGWEVIKGMAMILVTGLLLATVALACSTLISRVQGATVLAYAFSLFFVVGTFMVYAAQGVMDGDDDGDEDQSKLVLVLNPLVGTADVLDKQGDFGDSPFAPIQEGILDDDDGFGNAVRVDGFDDDFQGGPAPEFARVGDGDDQLVPFWMQTLLAYAVMGGLSFAVAARRIRTPSGTVAL